MSDPVSTHFDSIARDRSVPGVRVLYTPFQPGSEITTLCDEILSPEERARAGKIKRPAARDLFIQRRAFQRYCAAHAVQTDLSSVDNPFDHDGKGCPVLAKQPDMHFSFAACKLGFVGAWSEVAAPGVDIENPLAVGDAEKLARNYFTPGEFEIVVNGDTNDARLRFCRLWCLKEAALKSVGEGLPYGLDTFEFELQPESRCIGAPQEWGGPDTFEIHEWGEECARAALVVRCLTNATPGA